MERRTHWSDRYVGMPWREGEFDCGELARRVLRERFGREVAIPSERWYCGRTVDGPKGRLEAMAGQIRELLPDFAEPVEQPEEGHGALMFSGSRRMHIGMYCQIAGEGWILHCCERAGEVIRTRVRDLAIRGFRLEGFYRWI